MRRWLSLLLLVACDPAERTARVEPATRATTATTATPWTPGTPATPATTETTVPDGERRILREAGVDLARLRCNQDRRWGAMLREDAQVGGAEILELVRPKLVAPLDAATEKKIQHVLFWRMVRAVLLEGNNNNLGAFALRGRRWSDESGKERPVLVFRSGITPSPDAADSCFRSLLVEGGVRHVVNLFDGELPVADLIDAEARTAATAGATYHSATDGDDSYGPWRDLLRTRYDDPDARRRASLGVARLIRDQVLAPDGKPPRGNIYFHCGGGMHRSGMIAAIVERCVNREPLAVVEEHYRYHVAWRDAGHPGGEEPGNLRFIREFDCSLLDEK